MYVYVQNKLDFTRGANSRGDQNNILSVGENGKTIENYFSALNLPAISHPPTSSNWLVYFGLAKKIFWCHCCCIEIFANTFLGKT